MKLGNDLGGKLILHTAAISLIFVLLLYVSSLSNVISYGAIIFLTFAIIDVIDFTAHKKSAENTRAIVYMELALTFFIMGLAILTNTTVSALSVVVVGIIFLAILVEGLFIRSIEQRIKKTPYPVAIQGVLDKGYSKVLLFVINRAIYLISFLILFSFLLLLPSAPQIAYLSFAFLIDAAVRGDIVDTKRVVVVFAAAALIAFAINAVNSGFGLTIVLGMVLYVLVFIMEVLFHKIKIINLTRINLAHRMRIGR